MFWFNWIKAANRGFTRLSLQMTDDQAGRSGEYTRCCKVSKILTSYKWYPCLLGDACNAASSDCWTASWREHHSEFSLSLSFHVSFTWFKRCVVWCGFRNHHNSFCMVKDRIQRDFIFNFNAERERERLEFDTSAKDRSNRRTTCTFNWWFNSKVFCCFHRPYMHDYAKQVSTIIFWRVGGS